jgi:phospholipid/cholesterol/gamma-HCH transport system substrate-binding protein
VNTRTKLIAAFTAAAMSLSGCGFKGLYSTSLPGGADLGDHPYTITATFADVLDLVPQSAVKVNDIAIGKVTAISLDGWSAKVTMSVNNSVKLPNNARALVSQTSLLGEKYVALLPPLGAADPTDLHQGSSIPLKDTRSAPEVEEVLGALSLLLNNGGVNQIQVIARELSSALKGNENSIRDLLDQLNIFVGTLDQQKGSIVAALQNIDTLAITLNKQKKIITDALDTFPQALAVLSQERGKLVTLLTSLSKLGSVATDVISSTQTELVQALRSLSPALEQLNAAGDNFPQALRIMGTFPFPLGTTRELVRGDYANLYAYVNLDLSAVLCQVPGADALCKLLTANAKQTKLTPGSGTAARPATQSTLTPMLIGTGK